MQCHARKHKTSCRKKARGSSRIIVWNPPNWVNLKTDVIYGKDTFRSSREPELSCRAGRNSLEKAVTRWTIQLSKGRIRSRVGGLPEEVTFRYDLPQAHSAVTLEIVGEETCGSKFSKTKVGAKLFCFLNLVIAIKYLLLNRDVKFDKFDKS